jgi:hypothetical protein
MNEHEALEIAIETAKQSPCCKSKRGAILWHRGTGHHVAAFNAPPLPFVCGKDEACRQVCNKICNHAEAKCLIGFWVVHAAYEMLHIKVVDGQPVASGPPSCWQCSRLILASGIKSMWLLHDVLRRYTPEEFHEITLKANGLPRNK